MKPFKTKLASRFAGEYLKTNMDQIDQIFSIAQTIDRGEMKIGDARLAMKMTLDWQSATLEELAGDAAIPGSPVSEAKKAGEDENLMLEAMARMHGKSLAYDKFGTPVLVSESNEIGAQDPMLRSMTRMHHNQR